MEYHLRVLDDDEKTTWFEYDASFRGLDYPSMKGIVEKLTVSIEENIHPIVIDIAGHDNGIYTGYRLYFSRKLAKKWLHRLSPCSKSGGDIRLRAVDWKK